MTSQLSKNRQTTRPNTRRWNRLKALALGASVLLNLAPSLPAAEEPASTGRRSVPDDAAPRPAAERWKRLKSQHDISPATVTRAPRIEQPTLNSDGSGSAVIRPIQDEQKSDFKAISTSPPAETTPQTEVPAKAPAAAKTAAAPVKSARIVEQEPEWVLPTPITAADSDPEVLTTPPITTRPAEKVAHRPVKSTAEVAYEDYASVQPPAEDPSNNRGTPRPLTPQIQGGPPRKTTQVRRIGDIAPLADFNRETEINKYAAEKAREFNVRFGGEKYQDRNFPQVAMNWAQPASKYYPLYFEDPALERYGHSRHHLLQPVISSARFTTQIALLPYQMTINPPCDLHSPLGWYRPGDVAPKLHYQFPWNTKAAIVEAATVSGIIFAIP